MLASAKLGSLHASMLPEDSVCCGDFQVGNIKHVLDYLLKLL